MGQEGAEQALASYSELMETFELTSGALYYNAGIAATRAGKLGWASWAFRQAEGSATLSSLREDARHNLAVIQEQLTQRSREKRPRFQVAWEKPVPVLVKAKHHLPLRLLVWISGAIGILAALLIVKGKILLGIPLALLYAAGISLGIAASETSAPVRGVVTHSSPLLLEGTHGDANRLSPAPAEGQVVQFQGNTHPEFLRVVLPDGSEGWMPRDHVKELTHE